MKRVSKVLFVAAASLAFAGTALAQDAPPADPPAGGGDATPPAGGETTPPPATGDATMAPTSALPPLTLGAGKIEIGGETVTINLSADAVGKPISLAPAIYYGVNDKLTVGVTHDAGSTMWSPRPAFRTITIVNPLDPTMTLTGVGGAGICLTGEDNGCNKVYDNVGLDALFSLAMGKFSVAAHGGLDVFSFDPFTLSLRAGVLGRYEIAPKIAVSFDPRISIGLTERDFNKETIDVPAWLWFMASPKLAAYVSSGIAGPLDGFGDAFSIPLGVGANFNVNEKLSAGLDFQFLNIAGKNSTADARAIGIRVGYKL